MNPQLASFVALLRRYPFAASCVVLALVLGGASYFLWDQVDELKVAHDDRAKEGEEMLKLLVTGSTQRQELAGARDAARKIDDNLIVEANLADNYWYFFKLEEQTKVRLPELHQLNSPPDTSTLYRRIPYTLRVAGTYDQLAAFVLALETGPRLANITSFTFTRGGQNGLSLDLTLDLLGKK